MIGSPFRAIAASCVSLALAGCAEDGASTGATGSASGAGSSASNAGSSASNAGSGGATGSASSASGASSSSGGGGDAACPSCGEPKAIGKLGATAMKEISGVVASATHAGVFYVHNDSGDAARFFAIDAEGALLATFEVTNAKAIDWEDIARGPCPAGSCLYLADVGDNAEKRASYTVYRVPEPKVIADAGVEAEALAFTYPDGSHNSETLLAHPTTGALTVVTKVFVGASGVYEFPAQPAPGASSVLTKIGEVQPPDGVVLITGGDVDPKGSGVLLRTYSNVWLYPMEQGASVGAALAKTPCPAPVAEEAQGEAVGWLPAGDGYITVGEGLGAAVNQVTCGAR